MPLEREEGTNTVEYDLTEHVLSYLPTPFIPEDKTATAPTAAKGTKTMSNKAKGKASS